MYKSLLLIIDMQKAMTFEKAYNFDNVVGNIQELLKKFREEKQPVVFVQHTGPDGSIISKDAPGWPILDELAPISGESIVHKNYNSGFKKTNLEEVLNKYNAEEVVLVGMQTEYCIDTTLRVGFEKGYKFLIPENTNTTFDNGLISGEEIYKHHNSIFDGRFGKVVPLEDVL